MLQFNTVAIDWIEESIMTDLCKVLASQLAVEQRQKEDAENQFKLLLGRDEDQSRQKGTDDLRKLFVKLLVETRV